ncbi:MAG: EscN/YscN/HrcN family type III secretion system ATPase [Lentisphaerae bacterium GWF2_52_8]|nr:MAG: EscN/YscN/HrcN family type III secretion system ATPase [Lentisphaerae bacterium GWF2_52_8]
MASNIASIGLSPFRATGSITKLVGLTLESAGPICSVGDLVSIQGATRNAHFAEVVGFRDDRVLLFPLDNIDGVRSGDRVILVNEGFTIPVGPELLGRVLDGLGRPVDGGAPLSGEQRWKIRREAPNSMLRRRITEPFLTGVRAIDSSLMCGCGQRMGIFSGSGVGKSSLMGMVCRNSSSDLNVIALIGERGKEVLDFIEDSLGEEGLRKSVVIVSTSDKSPLQRVKGAETAMAIAEYFRGQGNNVLFVMDSVTRYAMAQREIGLAVGEPPATRGYPPSVFNMMPALLERAGTDQNGSITGIFTVLVEGDDMNDPIGDTARGILDGHIVLSRDLAAQAHYPAIDILQSVSRVMSGVASKEHIKLAQELRKLLAAYKKAEDLINIGAYKEGSNPDIDRAIQKRKALEGFLTQELDENTDWEETLESLKRILGS